MLYPYPNRYEGGAVTGLIREHDITADVLVAMALPHLFAPKYKKKHAIFAYNVHI